MHFGRKKRSSESEEPVHKGDSKEKEESKKSPKKSKKKVESDDEDGEEMTARGRRDLADEERRQRFEAKKKKEEKKRTTSHPKKESFSSAASFSSSFIAPQNSLFYHAGSSRGARTSSSALAASTGAIPKVDPESQSTKSKSASTTAAGAAASMSMPKKTPSRFSLRRFFYGNPFLAQPFLPSPLATPVGSASSRYRRRQQKKMAAEASSAAAAMASAASSSTAAQAPTGVGAAATSRQEDAYSWRDNLSSCSSLQSGGVTSVGPDGKVIRECPLCLSRVSLDMFPLLRNCHHLFCIECLQFYVKIELQEGRVNIKCPQCVEPMHPNDVESLIGDKNSNLLKLYEFLMLRRLLSTDPDTRWCPGPNCTYAVIAAGCASCPRIQCERPGCGFSFCYHCKAEWHPNQTCDMARASRQPLAAMAMMRSSSISFSQESGLHASEVKVCPRCNVLIVKMDDGSCNHMTCAVCAAEFCWLCMKEISDLHYLSPSGCTFWGKKPWSRKKKLMWQLGTLVGAPVGIAMLAGISVPAMIIGIPVWVGRKLHAKYSLANKHKRNLAITGGVVASIIVSPVLAGLAVSIGVPILLAYVYGVVPISLCRSEGCGVSTTGSGVKIDVDEEMPYRPMVLGSHVANPSIGEVSLGASLSLGSACHLEEDRVGHGGIGGLGGGLGGLGGGEASSACGAVGSECDRESASNTAIAGTSRTVSLASSYYNANSAHLARDHHRLEVGADVHSSRKKQLSMSSERLSETVSLGCGERSATVSLAENDGTASTRALAGSILAYRFCSSGGTGGDTQSVGSYRMTTLGDQLPDEISLRSLPNHNNNANNNPRSLSPISNMSGDELASGGGMTGGGGMGGGGGGGGARRSSRRRPHLDKQLSENSSLMSAEDATSERVRFDDNISFIDERGVSAAPVSASCGGGSSSCVISGATALDDNGDGGAMTFSMAKSHKPGKLDTSGVLPEETAEELALVISPEPRRNLALLPGGAGMFGGNNNNNVTLLSIGGDEEEVEAVGGVEDEGDARLEIVIGSGEGGGRGGSNGGFYSAPECLASEDEEEEAARGDEKKRVYRF